MKRFEKIDVRSRHHSRCAKYIKRATNKTLRRLGRLDPEDAPRLVREATRGWVS